jgi:hypothetical protein
MTPSRNRPPDSSCSDMAATAKMAGDLAPGCTTDEPSPMAVVWPARYASGVSASRAQVSGTRRLDCHLRRRQVMTSETTPGAPSTGPPERPVRCGTDSHADQPGLARITAGRRALIWPAYRVVSVPTVRVSTAGWRAWPAYFSLLHKRRGNLLDPHIWGYCPRAVLDFPAPWPWLEFVRQADLYRPRYAEDARYCRRPCIRMSAWRLLRGRMCAIARVGLVLAGRRAIVGDLPCADDPFGWRSSVGPVRGVGGIDGVDPATRLGFRFRE